MAIAYDQQIATYIQRHNTAVFDNIGKAMDALVRKKTKARTKKMSYVLRHREALVSNSGNWGSFPVSELRKTVHAHSRWRWKRTKTGYMIMNEHRASDGYPYVRNLIAGTGWSADVLASNIGGTRADGEPSRLIRYNGKVFSSQMPQGLNPWIYRQRDLLIQDIKLASGHKRIKGGKLYE